jgi:hypothetical protein
MKRIHVIASLMLSLFVASLVISTDAAARGRIGSHPTALYTRVATNTIRDVMSPLDRLTPLKSGGNKPPA